MLNRIFKPTSVAVVGASRKEGKVGHSVLKNIIEYGFEGEIFPINPAADEILGLKCYKDVSEVGAVDLIVVCVPNVIVPKVIRRASAKGAVVISAGFREIGKEGLQLEQELLDAAKGRTRIIGPNCLGIIAAYSKLNASFSAKAPEPGHIAFISQSGALCTAVLDLADKEAIGFSYFISLGNKCDVDEADLLEFLKDDEHTKAIALYLEGVKDGKKLMCAAEACNKPVVAIKSGRTAEGAKAASSHTGALAGSYEVFKTAARQSGITVADSLKELFDICTGFSLLKIPETNKVAIVTNAGGPGVLAADACAEYGLELVRFSDCTIRKLKDELPPHASIYNPVDVLGDATADRYEKALEAVIADENVAALLVILTPQAMTEVEKTAEVVAKFQDLKPIVASFMGGTNVEAALPILKAHGVPNYDEPRRAVRVLGALNEYRGRELKMEEKRARKGIKVERNVMVVRKIIEETRAAGTLVINEREGRRILKAYGIPVPEEDIASSPDEALEIARRMGFPVVLKAFSPELLHKTDVGGVQFADDEGELRDAYLRILSNMHRFNMKIEGIIVQERVEGVEVIVGVTRDPQFGHVLTFGLGGIYVEVLKDVSRRILPIDEDEAEEMIREIKAYPLLMGYRGSPKADISCIKDVILKLSQIPLDFPEINELEVNPLITGERGCKAVDVLITIREGGV
ncbi:acetate--CoA ligase family protein [Candidatus Alkanophaga liquidiphilum]